MSRDTVRIRPAVADDADALGEVSAGSWEATYRGMIPDAALDEWIGSTHADWRDALAALGADSPSRAWVAERRGEVIGYATTSPARDTWRPPPHGAGELTNLYLDPADIGRGVGRLLYDHAVADLRDRGFDTLVVWAFRDNERACRFYARRGLRIDVPDHDWVLADVPCAIVRFRGALRHPATAGE